MLTMIRNLFEFPVAEYIYMYIHCWPKSYVTAAF